MNQPSCMRENLEMTAYLMKVRGGVDTKMGLGNSCSLTGFCEVFETGDPEDL